MKPSEKLLKIKKDIESVERDYVNSPEFKLVAEGALVDFVKRVKRGLMPQLDQIKKLESEAYLKLRKEKRGELGEQAKPTKSNATDKDLDDLIVEIVRIQFGATLVSK